MLSSSYITHYILHVKYDEGDVEESVYTEWYVHSEAGSHSSEESYEEVEGKDGGKVAVEEEVRVHPMGYMSADTLVDELE